MTKTRHENYFQVDIPVKPTTPVVAGDMTPTHLEVKVNQQDGGMSWFNGTTSKRGVYVSAGPVAIAQTDSGFESRGFMLSRAGVKRLLEENKRRNDKRGAALGLEIASQLESRSGPAWDLVQHVLRENQLSLVETCPKYSPRIAYRDQHMVKIRLSDKKQFLRIEDESDGDYSFDVFAVSKYEPEEKITTNDTGDTGPIVRYRRAVINESVYQLPRFNIYNFPAGRLTSRTRGIVTQLLQGDDSAVAPFLDHIQESDEFPPEFSESILTILGW